jgi:hypothetical protein
VEQGRKIPRQPDSDISIESGAQDFLEFIKKEKRPNTYKRCRAVVNHFRYYFSSFARVSAVSPADVDAFRDERLSRKNPWGQPISPANVNSEVAMIRVFYYYLQRFRDPALVNPAARLKPLAVTTKIVDSYEEDDRKDRYQRYFFSTGTEGRTTNFTGF